MMDQARGNCVKEYIAGGISHLNEPALKADLSFKGVWETQMEALFDVHDYNTDASSSYVSIAHKQVFKKAEDDNKIKYTKACKQTCILFTPLMTSGEIFRNEFNFFRFMDEKLSEKWENHTVLIG